MVQLKGDFTFQGAMKQFEEKAKDVRDNPEKYEIDCDECIELKKQWSSYITKHSTHEHVYCDIGRHNYGRLKHPRKLNSKLHPAIRFSDGFHICMYCSRMWFDKDYGGS